MREWQVLQAMLHCSARFLFTFIARFNLINCSRQRSAAVNLMRSLPSVARTSWHLRKELIRVRWLQKVRSNEVARANSISNEMQNHVWNFSSKCRSSIGRAISYTDAVAAISRGIDLSEVKLRSARKLSHFRLRCRSGSAARPKTACISAKVMATNRKTEHRQSCRLCNGLSLCPFCTFN